MAINRKVRTMFVGVPRVRMGRLLFTICLTFLVMATVTFGVPPRKSINVPFGRNYFPTWAFDHIKYLNGGSEVHLVLDKYTGEFLCLVYFCDTNFIM